MRTLVAPKKASTPSPAHRPIQRVEQKPRLTRRGRQLRALGIIAAAALGAGVATGNAVLDGRERAHEVDVVKALKDDKNTVTITREPDETDDMLIDRTYADVPEGVRPALKDYLKSKEVDGQGKYVGPIALKGYDMPVDVEGLDLQANVAELYRRQEDAQQAKS